MNKVMPYLILILLLLSPLEKDFPQAGKEIETRLKAAYILNFLHFVKWPDYVFKDETSPVYLAVIGEDPFGNIIDETLAGEKAGHHPIIIKRYKNIYEINEGDTVHIAFISKSEKGKLNRILNSIKKMPVLTISDIEGFSEKGGSIEFFIEEEKLKFAVNIQNLKESDIEVSSKLLRLAKVINPI